MPDFLLKAKHVAGSGRRKTFNKCLLSYLSPLQVPASFEATMFILVIKQKGAGVSMFSIFSMNDPFLARTSILALWNGVPRCRVSLGGDFREWPLCLLLGLGKDCCLSGGRDLWVELLLREIFNKFSFYCPHLALLTLSYLLPLILGVGFSGKIRHCLSCPYDRLRLQFSGV